MKTIFDYSCTNSIIDIIQNNNADWFFSDVAVILNTKVKDNYCVIRLCVSDNTATLVMKWDEKNKVKQHNQKYSYTNYPSGDHDFIAVKQNNNWIIMLSSEF